MKFNLKQAGLLVMAAMIMTACENTNAQEGTSEPAETPVEATTNDFQVEGERFADIQVLRYQIPGFDELSAKEKELAYYLYQAALSGRDMIWDQKYEHNLRIRKTLEAILSSYSGDKSGEDWEKFETYAKQVFFSNGIHHHYSNMKFNPGFSYDYFKSLLDKTDKNQLPLEGKSVEEFASFLQPILFDPSVDRKLVDKDPSKDIVAASATNFYKGLTQKEVEEYYKTRINPSDPRPISWGLNSQMVKEKGKVIEKPYKVNGLYGQAIEKVVYWLEKAKGVAENPKQAEVLGKLIQYYRSGDLKDWDAYNIAWVQDTTSRIDVINGFIEVYGDPMAKRGSYESVVAMKDMEASKRIEAIARQAQWFEDNSPIPQQYKKENVKGISARVITVIAEAGDAAPSTPIGINLPNSNWIRTDHGSKSVSLGNIVGAYNIAGAKSPVTDEFYISDEIRERQRKYAAISGDLHTDMHEVIGHASGKLKPGVAPPDQTLKHYYNTLEEARADLVALYYIIDPKLVEIGVSPSTDVGKAEYDRYITNGLLLQLNRLNPGENLEEAHMQNRQLVAQWAYEKGKAENVIEKKIVDGKTYFVVNDYNKLRTLFGQLLSEIQRIKSEGDYAAANKLVEGYGVKVDQNLVKEVKKRFEALNVAPYKGFIQPKLVAVEKDGKITDVKVEYPDNFLSQMLEYGKNYSYLPVNN